MKTCLLLTFLFVTLHSTPLLTGALPGTHEYYLLGYINNNKSQTVEKIIYQVEPLILRPTVTVFLINCADPGLKDSKNCEKKQGDSDIRLYRDTKFPYDFSYKGRMNATQVADWVQRIVDQVIIQIPSVDFLKEMVEEYRFVYVFFDDKKDGDLDAITILAKKYNQHVFTVVLDPEVRTELGQGARNLTIYKHPFQLMNKQDQPGGKSFQAWQSFVISRAYPQMNFQDLPHIIQSRFTKDNIEFAALECGDSYQCVFDVVPQFYEYFLQKKQEFPFQVRYHEMVLRENHMIRMYYHMKGEEYPMLVYTRIKDGEFFVYTQPISVDQPVSEQFNAFLVKAQQNDGLVQTRLSQQIPPNKGIIGKGSARLVQHLVYDTLEKCLKQNPNKYYLTLFTIIGSGCGKCEQFFKQFKKAASFLEGEQWIADLVFARYDTIKNTVKYPIINKVPQLLLFKPLKSGQTERSIVKMDQYHDFDNLLGFIRRQLIEQRQKEQQQQKAIPDNDL